MNSWKVILATIVIFGAGVITGGLLVNHVQSRPRTHAAQPNPANALNGEMPGSLRPEILNRQFVQELSDKLDLTPEQREKIEKIIGQGQQSTRDLWKLVAPQFQMVWRDTRQQIREVLTPEQRKQFELLMKQQRPFRRPPSAPPSTNAPPVLPSSATNGPAV